MTRRFKHYTLNLKGEHFEVCGHSMNEATGETVDFDDIHLLPNRWIYSSIYDAYDKPSETKIAIWEEWVEWFRQFDYKDVEYAIVGKNCMQFSIGAKVRYEDEDTGELKAYYLYITRDHNRAYEIRY